MKAICIKVPHPTGVVWRRFKIYHMEPFIPYSEQNAGLNLIIVHGIIWKHNDRTNHCYITEQCFNECFMEIKDE